MTNSGLKVKTPVPDPLYFLLMSFQIVNLRPSFFYSHCLSVHLRLEDKSTVLFMFARLPCRKVFVCVCVCLPQFEPSFISTKANENVRA